MLPHGLVAFCQPPRSRPISLSMAATCWYWPCESQPQRVTNRTIDAHPRQRFVGPRQTFESGPTLPHIGLFQPFPQVKGGVQQPAGDRVAVRPGKVIGNRYQPGQHIECPGKNRHLLSGRIICV